MSYISPTSGSYFPDYKYLIDDDGGDVINYHLVNNNGDLIGNGLNWDISYTRSTLTWSQNSVYGGSLAPDLLNSSNDHSTATATIYNPVTVYAFTGTNLMMVFSNPHWEDPTPTGTEGINPNDFLSASLTYNFATNRLSWILPASYSSTSDPLITAHRTDYILDNDTLWLPATPGYTTYIIHTQGTPSIGNSTNDISPGQWSIRRKISAPSGSTGVVAQVTFTQIEVDAYNAAVAAQAAADAAAAAQAAADAAAAAQAALDAAAAAQAAADAAAAAQAAADAAAAGSNAPPNTPRGRRGNHNFW